jgi:hypothetical protein
MAWRLASIVVSLSGLACACGGGGGAGTTARTTGEVAPVGTASPSVPASIQSQIATASSDECTLISAADVAASFDEPGPLGTGAMGEANGPACGYPHPRHGGYLLVLQFRQLSRWDEYASSGRRVDGLGREAQLVSSSELFVRDEHRNTVLMILAPDGDAHVALFRVASRIYGVSPERVLAQLTATSFSETQSS